MIGIAAALALGWAPLALPEGRARYRVEIADATVGVAELTVSCSGRRCAVDWRSELRLPAAAGGTLRTRHIRASVDRAGRLVGAPVDVEAEGVGRHRAGPPGDVPLSLAEVVLAEGPGCIPVLDEETGRRGQACASLEGGRIRVRVPGATEEVTPGADGFPEVVAIPGEGARFTRDARAEVPATAPALEVRVPGPASAAAARRFCGRAPDPPAPDVVPSSLPEPRPDGRSCREQAQAYAEAVRGLGLRARVAVGVAHDGEGFVWHAWAEVRTGAGWVAVDPALGQLPARGPRFTIARHAGDPAGLAEAGRRILECWGRARVE